MCKQGDFNLHKFTSHRKELKMKKWSSQWTQFMQLRKEAWKKFRTCTGFEPVTSRLPVRCSTNWAMKPLTLGAGQLWVHVFPWKKWVVMIYEINHIWTVEMKWKWRNDHRSERNCKNCIHCDDHFFIFISFPQFIWFISYIINRKEVIEQIPVSDRAEGITHLDFSRDALPMEHTLGVQWCIESDAFKFTNYVKDRLCTQHGILSTTISSIFDLLSFVA